MPATGKEYADEQALIKLYTEAWGLKQKDAEEEASTIMKRGPSSPIYQNRMTLAWQHAQVTDQAGKLQNTAESPFPEASMADPAQVDPAAYKAQQALNARRAALGPEPAQPGLIAPVNPNPNPEASMADPKQVDPAAYQAQDALNQRKAKLRAMPNVDLGDMYQFYRNGLGFAPEDAMGHAAEEYQRGLRSKAYENSKEQPPQPPVPIAPIPMKPAAVTPAHLEDANLSSWQQLANYLGYSARKR